MQSSWSSALYSMHVASKSSGQKQRFGRCLIHPVAFRESTDKSLVLHQGPSEKEVMKIVTTDTKNLPSAQLARRLASKWPKPRWHAPWQCYRVISGHLG